jgi:hypothetical protein
MPWKKKTRSEIRCPTRGDVIEVAVLIGAIDFIPHNGIPEVRKMNANLVHPARDWTGLNERECALLTVDRSIDPTDDSKMSAACSARFMDDLFHPD